MAAEAALISGGSQALSGMLEAMYKAEEERRRRMQEAQAKQMDVIGSYGQNQQAMLAQMLNTYKTALGVG
jgi:hypothetical protein